MGSWDLFTHDLAKVAATDPAAFSEVLYRLADDLRATDARPRSGPFATAAVEAGFAVADAALRYARIADPIAEDMADPPAAAA
jgi:hypothetical protein